MKYIFFSILTTLAFLSCSSPRAPKTYSFECYARFDESSTKMNAEATLKEGAPNLLPVEPPGGIRYQKVAMHLIPVQGITYQYSYLADFTKEHLFQWKTDAEGKTLEFTLQMSSLDSAGFEQKVLSRKQAARYSWKGAALERGETLVFIWENTAKGLTIPMELYNVGSTTAIDFPAVKIAEISPGDWTYYVVRKKLQKGTVEGVSVSGVTEYYTNKKAVKVF